MSDKRSYVRRYTTLESLKCLLCKKATLVIELECPICDSDLGDGSKVLARVLLEDNPLDQKLLVREGFLCYVCGLHIDPSQQYLARHFVPTIPPDVAANYLKDIVMN